MNTFLPYPNYADSARVLDTKRLGKQRVEVLQMLNLMLRPRSHDVKPAWSNHPAIKMWVGYEHSLLLYGFAICDEWIRRGFKDTVKESLKRFYTEKLIDEEAIICRHPYWLGGFPFHRAHQSNLIRKDPSHYRKFWPDVPDNLPYVWPSYY